MIKVSWYDEVEPKVIGLKKIDVYVGANDKALPRHRARRCEEHDHEPKPMDLVHSLDVRHSFSYRFVQQAVDDNKTSNSVFHRLAAQHIPPADSCVIASYFGQSAHRCPG